MISLDNIHSLSDFQRRAKAHIRRLKKSGNPAVLTVNGEAALVVQSAAAYQRLVEELELLQNLTAINEGMAEADRGEGVSAEELMLRLRKGKRVRKAS